MGSMNNDQKKIIDDGASSQRVNCRRCGYILFKTERESDRCPECGLTAIEQDSWASRRRRKQLTAAYVFSIVSAGMIWIGFAIAGRNIEAWDNIHYQTIGYPLMALIVGCTAFLIPNREWRWPLAIVLTQDVILCISMAIEGYRGSFLSVILFASTTFFIVFFFLLPPALIGGWIRKMRESNEKYDGTR
jgi:uncharacterized paraquat-inducible protein A